MGLGLPIVSHDLRRAQMIETLMAVHKLMLDTLGAHIDNLAMRQV